MKKHIIFKIIGVALMVFMVYKIVIYIASDFGITTNKLQSKIKLSELINISENRVDYSLNYYINKDFVGFNALIDERYFLTVTKLGKIINGYELISTNKQPRKKTNFNFFSFSDINDKSGRYIDLDNFPFNTKKLYYFNTGQISRINQSEFYEIEGKFSLFNISFENEDKRDFGYVGFEGKQSISFINYKGNLFVINLIPIGVVSYKSLHSLTEKTISQK
ncbi:hypothetical protein [Flavobacterium branchiicola]|uniref:Uncharacterized protein n=1 Tax=Flavobacterium branchiicola TaxID=1114875 RepID=A0ABV9PIC4_9FLAO|nr:hypothetical protein [Flavobacterium branchiicola]MBS7256136.1 hypothetical protein [Flavobacterium branchiicola]